MRERVTDEVPYFINKRCKTSLAFLQYKIIYMYLLEHDRIVIIHTSSLWKYEKRIIVRRLNVFPQPEVYKFM
jgi:hypothetical protein